ncbi:MAG: hypothetical protein ACI3VN_02120 [Candidatus Onthomonas sp.]
MSELYNAPNRRPGRRLRQKNPKPNNPDRLTRRLLLQLLTAVLLLALWLGLCRGMPERAAQWREALSGLLTSSQDLWGACRQLGEDLTRGEDPADALGDWCAQVFLPAEIAGAQTGERSG